MRMHFTETNATSKLVAMDSKLDQMERLLDELEQRVKTSSFPVPFPYVVTRSREQQYDGSALASEEP